MLTEMLSHHRSLQGLNLKCLELIEIQSTVNLEKNLQKEVMTLFYEDNFREFSAAMAAGDQVTAKVLIKTP